jgi:hypothetical protein
MHQTRMRFTLQLYLPLCCLPSYETHPHRLWATRQLESGSRPQVVCGRLVQLDNTRYMTEESLVTFYQVLIRKVLHLDVVRHRPSPVLYLMYTYIFPCPLSSFNVSTILSPCLETSGTINGPQSIFIMPTMPSSQNNVSLF